MFTPPVVGVFFFLGTSVLVLWFFSFVPNSDLWPMMKICVHLPGAAGLLLVNHQGEYLHRQISTFEHSSETAVMALSHHVWNEMG